MACIIVIDVFSKDENTLDFSNYFYKAICNSYPQVPEKAPNIHQKFVIIDQRIVWYGSINFLSFGSAEESIMRLDSINIANELIDTVEEML